MLTTFLPVQYDKASSLDARSADNDLALRELYTSEYPDELTARDLDVFLEARKSVPTTEGDTRRRLRRRLRGRSFNDDGAVELEARHHIFSGDGSGPSVTVHLRGFDDVDVLDAREYDDFEDLSFRGMDGVRRIRRYRGY